MSSSVVELGLDYFLGPRVLVFVNGFSASSIPCRVKISASAVELVFKDDFWYSRDSLFSKGLSVRNSLFMLKMSASAVELGFLDYFLGPGFLVFVNGF